jgi:hypothetical protein
MTRFVAKLALAAFVVFAVAVAWAGVGRADDKCTIATKGETPTAKACAKGGRGEAKKLMKEMVKKAKANNQKFTCEGCHKDLDNYELTKNANADYKKLEDASGVK